MSTAFLVMAGVTVAAEGLAVAWLVDNARFNRAQRRARLAHRLTGQLQRGWSGWVFGAEAEPAAPAVMFVTRHRNQEDQGQADAGAGARVLVLPAGASRVDLAHGQSHQHGSGQGGGAR